MNSENTIVIRRDGIKTYVPIFAEMQSFTSNRTANTCDEIWFLQHEPVFTMGRNARREHILAPGDIPIVDIDRGGQVTYHGPGQLIVYFLIDLRRRKLGIRELVSQIEQSCVELLGTYRIQGYADPKAPGVYVDGAKIASLGLRVKQNGSYHGLSINVDMDLSPFERINPCGYPNLKVVQLRDFVPNITLDEVIDRLIPIFTKKLGYNSVRAETTELF